MVLVALSAVLFDQWVRVGWGLGATLWMLTAIAAVADATTQRVRSTVLPDFSESTSIRPDPSRKPLLEVLVPLSVAAMGAGAFAVRTSWWLTPLNLLAVLGLAGAAIVASAGEDPWSLEGWRMGRWLGRGAVALVGSTVRTVELGLSVLPPSAPRQWRRLIPTVAVVLPVLVVVGALLLSADALLASYIAIDIDLAPFIGHLLVAGIGAWLVMAVVLWDRPAGPPIRNQGTPPPPPTSAISSPTATGLLGGLALLFALFVGVNLAAAAAGDGYVQRRTGLTYAEYARQGFFQLLAVAAITLTVLAVLRRRSAHTRLVRILALSVVMLIGAVIAIATRRLGLYERAYGATVLRLYSTWFAWWIGALFVPVGAAWAGLFPAKRWVGRASAMLALGWLVAVNVVNPEAVVARRNIAHAERTSKLDVAYLRTLGDDATPALILGLAGLPSTSAATLRAELCGQVDAVASRALGWSWSRHRAERAAIEHC